MTRTPTRVLPSAEWQAPYSSLVEDRDLMAAIGQVVVTAAALEYAIAILAAIIEGGRDQECEEHALALAKKSGGAMRALMVLTCAQLRGRACPRSGSPRCSAPIDHVISEQAVREGLKRWDRESAGTVPLTLSNLIYLWHDVKAVLDDRHVIAHSLALEDVEADGQAGLVIFHLGSGRETTLTTPALLNHLQDIRIAYWRFHAAIAVETRAAE
jgi:hypothetical protein